MGIKIEELKRGYYVRHNLLDKPVYYFDDDSVVFYDLTRVRAEELEGTPIQPALLMQNGFKLMPSEDDNASELWSMGCVSLRKKKGENYFRATIHNQVYMYAGYVQYLHELQEALDACAVRMTWNV